MEKTVLVTGAAGFIGYHLAQRLLVDGQRVLGVDCLNDYYDVALKEARLARLLKHDAFRFERIDLADRDATLSLLAREPYAGVVHLAAQPGVRYSLENPPAYIRNNVTAFANMLDGMRAITDQSPPCPHFVYASSSSVYGNSADLPLRESANVDHPVSLYAATKKANELMAHCYAHLYGIPATGLRFFTVYGPWGRPDMAIFKFTRMIFAGETLPVFNHGNLIRDYTYIDDIIEGVVRVLARPPVAGGNDSGVSATVYNIGNDSEVHLLDFIRAIESAIGKPARLTLLPMQPGDVLATHADVSRLKAATGFTPATPVAAGVARFVEWYKHYYEVA